MVNTSIHAYRKPFSMSMQTATVHNTIHWPSPVKIEQIQKYEDCKTKGLLIFLQIVWTKTHKPETFLLSSSIWSLVTEERRSKLHQVYRDTRLALQLTMALLTLKKILSFRLHVNPEDHDTIKQYKHPSCIHDSNRSACISSLYNYN